MYSKTLQPLAAVLLLALSSCAWIQDKPKDMQEFKSESLDLSCLNEMPDQLQTLFEGGYTFSDADKVEQGKIWRCLDKSLTTFSKHTRGATVGVYTSKELRDFANRYLPKNRLFDDKLVDSIFKLKRAVLGGTDTQISQEEIHSLIAKLNKFGDIMTPFYGHLGTLTRFDGKTARQKHVASEALNRFVMDLAELMSDSVNTVAWNDIIYFVTQLERYTGAGKPTALTAVREQLPLFQHFKLLLVGGDENAIERDKWKPIFLAVSHLYNSLFLTDNTSQLLESLSIEIDSTEQEQKRAVEKITGALKVLKNDPTLHARRPVEIMADSWGKVLLLNSFLFPRSQGSLALKPFLSSPTLRKIAGYIVDQALLIQKNAIDPALIQSMSENLVTLVEQAAVANAPQVGVNSPFSYSAFREYMPQVKPLFKDPKMYDLIYDGVSALKAATPIIIGRDSDFLTTKDLRSILQKATDLYLAWNKSTSNEESIAQSFEIILRAPSFFSLQANQLESAIEAAKRLANNDKLKLNMPWDKLSDFVKKGLSAKAVLFGNTDKAISNVELRQLAGLWDPFRKGTDFTKGLPDALAEAANILKNSPFAAAKIEKLIPVIDSFLPESQSIEKLGFTAEELGYIKAILVGGSNSSIERNEYTDLARVSSALVRKVYPIYQKQPKNFAFGLNSATFALAEAAFQSLIDSRSGSVRGYISNDDLKKIIYSVLNKSSARPVQMKTIETLLIGLNHRILQGNKQSKPKSLSGSISMDQLKPLVAVFHNISVTLADYENAFTAVDSKRTPLDKKVIAAQLTTAAAKTLLDGIQPIINGTTHLPYFSAPGKKNAYYYLEDLSYKSAIYHVLNWALPAYKIEADPTAGNMIRLTHNDLVGLMDDLGDLMYELGMTFATSTSEESATSRMQTINLFTQSGNGDGMMGVFETTEFLTMTFGGKVLLSQVRKTLGDHCYPEVKDALTIEKFSVACLKKVLFAPELFTRTYTQVAPQMAEHFVELTAEKRNDFANSALTAANAGWTEEGSLDLTDLEVLVSVPYYAENIFEKMDANFDGVLNFTEGMSGFPVFCGEIKKAAGSSVKGSCVPGEDPNQVEAVYGHMLFKGEPPRGIKSGDSIWTKIKEAKNFLLWVRYWNRLYRDPETRNALPPQLKRSDLLSIISNLSSSIAPAPALDQL